MTDKLTEIAIAICPKVKPWMDDPDVIQSGVCDCERDVETNYGPGQTACWITMNEIAKVAIEAHEAALEAKGLVIVPMVPSKAMVQKGSAGLDAYFHGAKDPPFGGSITAVYQAMLAALEVKDAD